MKRGFQVKSFTGVLWSSPSSWAAPKKVTPDFPGDVKSDSSGSSEPAKPTQNSSALQSEKSNSGGDAATPLPAVPEAASSPAVAPTASADTAVAA
jgi:INO80 complex subunit Ies4